MEPSINILRRFIRPRPSAELCELCGARLGAEHRHLIQPPTRRLSCACEPCAILFSHQADGRFRPIPRRAVFLPDFRLTDLQWKALMLPIELVFFFNSSVENRTIALYPGPGGATESRLSLEAWREIERENPVVRTLSPDVEALLVNRVRGRREYFVAPIDRCFELVGTIRAHWRGLAGGGEVWAKIDEFFDGLKKRSVRAKEVPDA